MNFSAGRSSTKWIGGKRLEWRRFWVPWDGKINLGTGGRDFLADPESKYGKLLNEEILYLEDLLSARCLVLSGQPGMGKTAEIDRLITKSAEWLLPGEKLIARHCRSIDSAQSLERLTVGAPDWRTASEGGASIRLVLDGVDEALDEVAKLIPHLVALLKEHPLDRIRVVLVCRAAEWKAGYGHELASLWGLTETVPVYELCPLRWKDAATAASALEIDPQKFWRALTKANAKGLAARPITLRFLLKEMKDGGRLSSSQHELYSNVMRLLCRDPDPGRQTFQIKERPSETQILRVTARLAMLMMIGGRPTLVMQPPDDLAANELSQDEVLRGEECVDGKTFAVTLDLLQAAIGSFCSFRGEDRYGFDHQTFAEHLAADYLRTVPVSQLRRLLCVPHGDKHWVAPQLAETAARLTAMSPTWCDYVIQTEPELLLRSDVTQLDEKQKSKAVAAFLQRAEREEAFDSQGTYAFYHTFSHSGLATQLRKYIANTRFNKVVRRMAISIAGAAKVKELAPLLWMRLRAKDDAFSSICEALDNLVEDSTFDKRFREVLVGKHPDNEQFDLMDLALQKLVPSIMPVRDVLPHLPRATGGKYLLSLARHLPKSLVLGDVPSVLSLASRRGITQGPMSDLNELFACALSLGLENLQIPWVLSAVTTFWLAYWKEHFQLPTRPHFQHKEPLDALATPQIRHTLVRSLMQQEGVESYAVLGYDRELVRSEDLEWILNELHSIPAPSLGVWARVATQLLYHSFGPQIRDLLLAYHAKIPEFRAVLPKAGKYDIYTTIERARVAQRLWTERRLERHKREWPEYTRIQLIEWVLRRVDARYNSSWVDFCDYAWKSDSSDRSNNSGEIVEIHDITSSPAWRELTEEKRSKLGESARLFLFHFEDDRQTREHTNNYTAAACEAVWLLREEIERDASLRERIKKYWLFALLDDSGGAVQRQLVSIAYSLSSRAVLRAFKGALETDEARESYMNCLGRYELWEAPKFGCVKSEGSLTTGMKWVITLREFKPGKK